MYKIMFSIPVHEKCEVILDTVVNFLTLNPECAVVLHLSQGLVTGEEEKLTWLLGILQNMRDVYVNPKNCRTGLYDIIQAHLSNFLYIRDTADFEYFAMCASNELFFKRGLYDHIKGYDACVDCRNVLARNGWFPGVSAQKDNALKEMLNSIDSNTIIGSQIEGQIYKKSFYEKICTVINEFYDWQHMEFPYPREEVYFSTIAWALAAQNSKLKMYQKAMFTFCPWKRQNLNVRIKEIEHLKNQNTHFFSCKRVLRNIDDYVRAYIRQDNNYFDLCKQYLPQLKPVDDFGFKVSELRREGADMLTKIRKTYKRIKRMLGKIKRTRR